MENEVKKIAVRELMDIYKRDTSFGKEVITALGKVGGKRAIKAILTIYNKDLSTSSEVINALGNAANCRLGCSHSS